MAYSVSRIQTDGSHWKSKKELRTGIVGIGISNIMLSVLNVICSNTDL